MNADDVPLRLYPSLDSQLHPVPCRCPWAIKTRTTKGGAKETDSLLQDYHDCEWGVPLHDDQRHFEFLVLESFQAGLSWQLVLQKREGFRCAFDNFAPAAIADYGADAIERLLQDSRIIRNRSKIEGAINNARCFLEIQKQWSSFDAYIWHFSNGETQHNSWHQATQIPAKTPLAEQIAGDLKQYGFRRLGAITVYAYLQAIGIVNDHLQSCFRYAELKYPTTQ